MQYKWAKNLPAALCLFQPAVSLQVYLCLANLSCYNYVFYISCSGTLRTWNPQEFFFFLRSLMVSDNVTNKPALSIFHRALGMRVKSP